MLGWCWGMSGLFRSTSCLEQWCCQHQVRLALAVFTQVFKFSRDGDPPPLVSCPRAVPLSLSGIPNVQSKSPKLQVVAFVPCHTIILYKKSLAPSSLCLSWSSCQLQPLERSRKKVLMEIVWTQLWTRASVKDGDPGRVSKGMLLLC